MGALLSGGGPAAPIPTDAAAPSPEASVRRIAIGLIRPSPLQPRKDFTPEALQELADSIREQGIVQPLLVRGVGGAFELIAGERRWRAAQLVGLTEVPVLERSATDAEVLELALIENLQRENLNPVEEAQGYQELSNRFQLTQDDIAKKVGKSRAAVANAMRLLRLPPPVLQSLREGRLSVGHAKVILGLDDVAHQQTVANRVLAETLTVRQTEEFVARLQTPARRSPTVAETRDPHVADLEGKLRERLGTKVVLRYRAGKGSLDIRYFSDAELNRILDLLGVRLD